MSINDVLGKVGSRKLIVTTLVLLCGTLVDLFAKNGLSVNLSNLMMALAGVFAVGNGMEHLAKKGENKTAFKVDLSPLQLKLDNTNESLTTVLNTLSFIIRATGLDKSQQPTPQAAVVQQGAVNRQAAANRQAVNYQNQPKTELQDDYSTGDDSEVLEG